MLKVLERVTDDQTNAFLKGNNLLIINMDSELIIQVTYELPIWIQNQLFK